MDKTVKLQVAKRDESLSLEDLRGSDLIPAVCYGAGRENIKVQMEYQPFRKAYIKAGDNTIVELEIDGKTYPTLVHEVQFHPVKGTIQHVDMLFIDMDVKVHASVPVVLTGESPAVKNLAGDIAHTLHEVEVKCLPANIPHEFVMDISGIEDFHTILHVSDLDLPADVELVTDGALMVVGINAPRKQEEELTPDEQEAAALESQEAENGGDKEEENTE